MIYLEDMMNVIKNDIVTVKCNGEELWQDIPNEYRDDMYGYDEFLDKYGTRAVKKITSRYGSGILVEIRG